MSKAEILEAIQQTTSKNGGVPLGQQRFANETGIPVHAWRGKFWLRWSEAIAEAGFKPNTLSQAYGNDFLLAKLAELTRQYKHFPTYPELLLAKNENKAFPGPESIYRLGPKQRRIELLRDFASRNASFKDVLEHLPETSPDGVEQEQGRDTEAAVVEGFVYMEKMGRHYKIGHTTAVPRRHRQISLELPEKPSLVHYIRTDDPEGIERYWHQRFAAFRANGEWFALSKREVRAFRRRRSM